MERKMHVGAIKPLYQRASELRNNATHAESKLNDEQRQTVLQNNGLVVLRFQNEEVTKTSEKVFLEIEKFLLKKKHER